ncbi:MAG: methyltransferase domain-containing protein [Xanthomonadaceae bacterium]|nr:methyltransferase domain-containing protein [Xanthomonadaceae bacterium]
MLGSLIPSSRILVERLLSRVDWKRAHVIVEYGPGIGTFTEAILERLPADGKLIAIETNRDFVDYLQQELQDPRLHVECGSAADVRDILQRRGLDRVDYVISGIPFSVMPDELRQAILASTHEVLKPDGAFLVYQFSNKVLRDLERTFGEVERGFVFRNVLPAHWYDCKPRG